jgi:peptide-methionine (R)-S-oxide reductase
VARQAGTERAFTGKYWDHWESGRYDCIGCGTPLFAADTKFDAGCGWPSYSEPVNATVVERIVDRSHGMVRIEVRCNRCGSHLGHVFNDGPAPTGERFCINSASIDFKPQD